MASAIREPLATVREELCLLDLSHHEAGNNQKVKFIRCCTCMTLSHIECLNVGVSDKQSGAWVCPRCAAIPEELTRLAEKIDVLVSQNAALLDTVGKQQGMLGGLVEGQVASGKALKRAEALLETVANNVLPAGVYSGGLNTDGPLVEVIDCVGQSRSRDISGGFDKRSQESVSEKRFPVDSVLLSNTSRVTTVAPLDIEEATPSVLNDNESRQSASGVHILPHDDSSLPPHRIRKGHQMRVASDHTCEPEDFRGGRKCTLLLCQLIA